jgi:hypothetical protein
MPSYPSDHADQERRIMDGRNLGGERAVGLGAITGFLSRAVVSRRPHGAQNTNNSHCGLADAGAGRDVEAPRRATDFASQCPATRKTHTFCPCSQGKRPLRRKPPVALLCDSARKRRAADGGDCLGGIRREKSAEPLAKDVRDGAIDTSGVDGGLAHEVYTQLYAEIRLKYCHYDCVKPSAKFISIPTSATGRSRLECSSLMVRRVTTVVVPPCHRPTPSL